MDTYDNFCDRVLEHIPRATPSEREQIRQELEDHLEDHREVLEARGFTVTAEEKAVEAMGDPADIGRDWNEQLSPFWLWAGRVCKTLCILLVLLAAVPFVLHLGDIGNNLKARFSDDPNLLSSDYPVLWEQELDIRQEFGEHIIRIYRVELVNVQDQNDMVQYGHSNGYHLQVYTISYPKNPLHYAIDSNILYDLRLNGAEEPWYGGGGGSGVGYCSWYVGFPIEKGLELAEITLDYRDNHFYAAIPLDWGGVA